jgi:Tfp pilus assembly protein PilF
MAEPATSNQAGSVPSIEVSISHARAWDRRTWWVGLLLAVLVLVAFFPVLDNGFVNWDDEKNFVYNAHFRGLGWTQLVWAWRTFLLGVYQPVAWLILEAQYAIWQLEPWGYHLTSILLYAVNTVVLFFLTAALLQRCQPALYREDPAYCFLAAGLATALFSVHPLRTEVVAWVSCQPYLPCALFYMLAVLAYLRAYPEGTPAQRGWLLGSFFLFAMALLSKAVAVSLPLVLLILDVYPLGRLGGGPGRWLGRSAWKVWLEKVPFVLLSVIFMDIAIAAKRHAPILAVPGQASRIGSAQVAQACYAIWFYVTKTVLPLDIRAYYPAPLRVIWYEPRFLSSILGVLGMSVGLFLVRRRCPALLAVWLSYLVILAPNLGIVRISNQIAADRYAYVPTMGAVVLTAAGVGWLGRQTRWARPLTGLLSAACLGMMMGLVILTWRQCQTWQTSEILWNHALNHGADSSPDVRNFVGLVMGRQGRLPEAKAHFAEALRLNPSSSEAHNNLGVVLGQEGKLAEAQAEFGEALRLYPQHVEASNNLASALARQGKLEEAVSQYTRALGLDPDNFEAHNNLGSVLVKLDRPEEAVVQFAEAIWINSNYTAARDNLKKLLLGHAKLDKAVAQHARALWLNPDDPQARQGLADSVRAYGHTLSPP